MIEKALSESALLFGNTNKVFASFERTPNLFVPEKMSSSFPISLGSGAKNDLTRHAKSQNHMQLEMVQRKSKSMSVFVTNNAKQFFEE
jgi:hypothetical protein